MPVLPVGGAKRGKNDAGKARWDLVQWLALEQYVAVLTAGAVEHGDEDWRYTARLAERYLAAAQRHLVAWHRGQRIDEHSGLPHLAHAICNIAFVLQTELESCHRAIRKT